MGIWFVTDGAAQAVAQQLEGSAGEVWKVVAGVLAGVVGVLALVIWKDVQEDRKEAKEREAHLRSVIEKRNGG